MTAQAPRDFLDGLIAGPAADDIKSVFEEMKLLYNRRLYHNLTLKIQEAFEMPELQSGTFLIDLFTKLVKYIDSRMNVLTLAKLAAKAAVQFESTEEKIAFLSEVEEKTKRYCEESEKDAPTYLRAHIVFYMLEAGQYDEVKAELETFEKELEETFNFETCVYSAIYRVRAAYHKARNHPLEFYADALLYLSYTDVSLLSTEEQVEIAFDIGISALIGDSTYNFQDLISHPVYEALKASDRGWLAQVMQAFNNGDMGEYESVVAKYSKEMASQAALVENTQVMKQKITTLCLMELIFDRQGVDRSISFALVAERTGVPLDKVEYLLMKALSLGLVKGKINQVEQHAVITWVQPRQLDLAHIAKMRDRLSEWSAHVHETLIYMEQETPDLFT